MTSKKITAAKWQRIKDGYRFYRNVSDFEMPEECRAYGDWQRVHKQGCDSKYGTIMVSHEMRAWRHPTFDEFLSEVE